MTEPFSKSELIAVTTPEAQEVLIELLAAALVYKDGTKFRAPTNLKQLIGDEPAGLGPISKKKIDFKVLAKLPQDSATVLERLTWGPPRGQVSNIKVPGKAIGWLLENNLLLALDARTVVLPREVGLHLRGGKVFKDYSSKAEKFTGTPRKQKDIDRAAIANISNFLRWCEELAHNWSDEPPVALRSGGLGIRDLKRSADHLGISESCVAFVAEVLYLGGLIVVDTDDQILPTNSFDIWMSRSLE